LRAVEVQRYFWGVADVFTRKKRSAVMGAIRAKNTKPEVIVRRALHVMGYRLRFHAPELPGKPDIVIPKIRTIFQVKGCFWHGHRCLKGRVPIANNEYWVPKIQGNKTRDLRNERRLRSLGWRVKTIWECDIRRTSPELLYAKLCRLTGYESRSGLRQSEVARLERLFALIRYRRVAGPIRSGTASARR
jgi:DNA mismatch endonuclease, patch repair protein